MAEYTLNTTNMSDDFAEIFNFHLQQQIKYQEPYDDITWVSSYKMALIVMTRFIMSDISDILNQRGIKDKMTQDRLTDHMIEHINSNTDEIFTPLLPLFGQYTVDDKVINVNFEKDLDIVFQYLAQAHAIALDKTIYEVGQIVEQQINKDVVHMNELYDHNADWDPDDVAKYCQTSPDLLEKYGPIVFMMRKLGFNENVFRLTMQYFASNMSLPYSDILKYYYDRSLTGRHRKKNIAFAYKFIDTWVDRIQQLKDNKDKITKEALDGQQELYKTWLQQ